MVNDQFFTKMKFIEKYFLFTFKNQDRIKKKCFKL